MKVYTGCGLGDFYYQIVKDVTECGRRIQTRHGDCLELPFPIVMEYEEPGYCWMNIPNRRFNIFFALAEVVWILSGNGSVNWISYWNNNMWKFADGNNHVFHGAYGLRIREWQIYGYYHSKQHNAAYVDQIREVVGKLLTDPFSRRAVISLWDPVRDNLDESNDYPCNNLVYFSLRDGVLEQTVVVRSNDLIWGTPHNAVQFSHLQALVAGMLKVKMGKMTYFVQNMHYYLDLYKPTLANIIGQAYSSHHLVALGHPEFTTVKQYEIDDLKNIVDNIMSPNKEVMMLEGSGYWNHTIPRMLLAQALHKRELNPNFVNSLIAGSGQTFRDLAEGFYTKRTK